MKYSTCKILMIFFSALLSINLISCLNTTKVKEYSKYKIPNINLLFFSENHKDILIDYLSKNSEWHVFPIYKTVIAVRRGEDKNCNPLLFPLPSAYPDGVIPSLKYNFLNLFPDNSQDLRYDLPENKAGENTEIRLAMKKVYDQYQNYQSLESNLVIESKNKKISFHAYESSRDAQRLTMTKYLVSISKELEQLAKGVKKNQYVNDSLLPLGSVISSSTQVIHIQKLEDEGSGSFSISGFINPGEKIIYLKVINKKTGSILLSDKEGTNAEYVGWSNDFNKKFKFCLGIKYLTGTSDDGGKILAEFQTWFKPFDNSPEKILDKQTLLIDVVLK